MFILLAASLALRGQPSVDNFCKAYQEERVRLAELPDGNYPSGVFDKTLSDANEFAKSFERVEKVAPEEIRSDVSVLKDVYRDIHDNPSGALSAGLSGTTAENNVEAWVDHMCGDE